MPVSDLTYPTDAAGWCLRVKTQPMTAADHAALEAWLAVAPERQDAFLRALELWNGVGTVEADLGLIDLRAEALGDLHRRKSGAVRRKTLRNLFDPRRGRWAAALVIAFGLGFGSLYAWQARATVYETGRGQTQIVQLADGSVVRMDADTRVRVRVAGHRRKLWVDKGRARLEVAHDRRGFEIYAGSRRISATDGAMSVEKMGDQVNVIVLKGKATVSLDQPGFLHLDDDNLVAPQIVKSNEELTADGATTAPVVRAADPNLDDVWQNGLLAFDDEPIAVAIARVNRFAAQPVSLGHIERRIKVSGIYRAGDTRAFLEGVCAVNGLSFRATDAGFVIEDGKTKPEL
jgi:transmembrane sensor